VKQALPNQRSPRHLLRQLVRELPSDKSIKIRASDTLAFQQMSTSSWSPSEGIPTKSLFLFLITLPRTAKSQEIFRLTAVCHIAIREEAYRAQNGLTQCHNCQQFGHVWVSPLFVVRGRPPAQRVSTKRERCLHSILL
jgi:hypothetical protein